MDLDGLGRRRLLGGAAAATIGGLAAATMTTPALADDSPNGVIGAWWLQRQDADGHSAYGVWTFAAGGVTSYRDIYPVNALLLGAWTALRGRRIAFQMWGALPPELAGGIEGLTARVAGEGVVRRDSLTTPYVVTIFDGATQVEQAHYEGQGTSTPLLR